MAEGRKRSRDPENEDADLEVEPAFGLVHKAKKARKETNAAAQRTLFVRSLPAIATSETLTELFSQSYPLKHATVVLDTETKQCKGYGFVTFADADDAHRAMEEFNGQAFKGRKMKVEIAQPRSREVAADGGTGSKKKSSISAEAAALKKARQEKLAEARQPPKLIIRNLPWSVKTPEQLAELFRKFGKVKHSTLPKVKDTQAGFGFVVMRGRKNAERALAEVNGTTVDGRALAVDWAVEKEVWENQKSHTLVKEDAEEDSDLVQKKEAPNGNEEVDDVANFMRNFGDHLESEDEEEDEAEVVLSADEDDELGDVDEDSSKLDDEIDSNGSESNEGADPIPNKTFITDNSTTLFIRNLPFTTLDADLKEHFTQFGPVRYARVVMDRATDRPRGTGFVCFFNVEDANNCYHSAPKQQPSGANAVKKGDTAASKVKHSLLQNEDADKTGLYTIDGRVVQISRAVEKEKAIKLTEEGSNMRETRDTDKRKLYLLSEGTVAAGTALYEKLSPSEVKMREDSAKQRKKLIQNNPGLHLSLTRLSIRNLPRSITSKDLKALAREAVVGFASDVKEGLRAQLSKEEEARGGEEMREAERLRKTKGKGIVRQAKIVFEGREGAKVTEESGAGRSRGYGFVEYSSHRWALMGLRWLNGHALASGSASANGDGTATGKKQRLIVEFAIENAQVVMRRKEREEKARTRSKEVLAARERGEAPEKEKKVLAKDTLMARTRKGMSGKKGRPAEPVNENPKSKGRGFERVVVKPKADAEGGGKGGKGVDRSDRKKGVRHTATSTSSSKIEGKVAPRFPPGEEGRLARRAQIIQKKRQMRRNRNKSGA